MKKLAHFFPLYLALVLISGYTNAQSNSLPGEALIPVIFDTDANNELDDQHALAYLLLNTDVFDVIGITVNATRNGGDINGHMDEAHRVVNLVGWNGRIPVVKGANGNFPEIVDQVGDSEFDGSEAVDFIIAEAMKQRKEPLVLIPVGKLTNIALALEKKPAIARRIRVVWLGSNYPEPGEYNLVNDTASMSYVLNTGVPFEMVTVRYGQSSGTAAVKVKRINVYKRMPGLGPVIEVPVTGRHGGTFTCFGDYSVDLFRHIEHLEDGCFRSLFDMAAVAIVKDPTWAKATEVPCPAYIKNQWVEQPENKRTILVWEDFDTEKILADFYSTLENAK